MVPESHFEALLTRVNSTIDALEGRLGSISDEARHVRMGF
jgi:hypothetical protein